MRGSRFIFGGFQKFGAPDMGVPSRPYNKDHNMFRSILGPLTFGSSHVVVGLEYCSQNGDKACKGTRIVI